MYVLCSPCILNPALRAEGITRPSDIKLFERARERCREFGIEMVPLPCPETIYLGSGRKPGTFLERLNTPEFADIVEDISRDVNSILSKRGMPLAINGVNSSPTCGVTSTYYGEEDGKPSKREGRGVFLAKFPGIPAMDVGEFSKYKVYLAAPLFSEAERRFNTTISDLLKARFFRVHVPQEIGDCSSSRDDENHAMIFRENLHALNASDIVVAIIDGADADSGTAWEMGYAYAQGKRVIALRTDFRRVGDRERVNLMLELSSTVYTSEYDLISELTPFKEI
jgi:nucleoside 2-deoxyribosyltransferase/predicted secreted protein